MLANVREDEAIGVCLGLWEVRRGERESGESALAM
jgi:hypothetical protein